MNKDPNLNSTVAFHQIGLNSIWPLIESGPLSNLAPVLMVLAPEYSMSQAGVSKSLLPLDQNSPPLSSTYKTKKKGCI